MALINLAAREIHGKIVYYGPGLGGKTTNLKYLHDHLRTGEGEAIVSIATESERTLFFDFLPVDFGTVLDFRIRFHLYTVPGQDLYEQTRAAVLNGVDGIVFVADAREDRLPGNMASLHELSRHVTAQGKRFRDFPLVMQYNKMDLPDAMTLSSLDHYLNGAGVPRFEATAIEGVGVFETLRAISKLVARGL